MNIKHLCERYNTYVSLLNNMQVQKGLTEEMRRIYWSSIEGKKAIEKTLRDLDWHLVFDSHGNAIDALACGD